MTISMKMAIFEATGKNSVLGRWGAPTHLQYGKKIKKFDRDACFPPKSEKPVWWQTSNSLGLWVS
jgi:hypothetical protein